MRPLLLVLPLLLAGCAGSLDVHRADQRIAPGQFAEVNLRLQPGQTVHWDWTATSTVRFNVHSHFGGNLTEYDVRNAAADKGSFTAPTGGSYSLLWLAPTEAYLTYAVAGDGLLESAI